MILVVSPGGTGSTALIERLRALGHQTNCPNDYDGCKHLPKPDWRLSKFEKVIYCWNDPLLAILSLSRRGIFSEQQAKLCPRHRFADIRNLWFKTMWIGAEVYGIEGQARAWQGKAEMFDWRDSPERKERFAYNVETVPFEIRAIYQKLDKWVQSNYPKCTMLLHPSETTQPA